MAASIVDMSRFEGRLRSFASSGPAFSPGTRGKIPPFPSAAAPRRRTEREDVFGRLARAKARA